MADFAKDKKENYPSEQDYQQAAGGSGADFATDKSENYPSTEPTTPSTTDTGQTTPNSNEEPKQETPPVANNGEQQATQTTGTQNDFTTPKANTPQVNPADYTFTESQLQEMEQQQTPQGGVVGDGSSTGLYNWDNPGTTIDKVLADPGNENNTGAIVNDYLKWAYRNNQPIDYFAINEAIHNKDISKSPADNAKEEKRQRNKEKWDKVGNFLLHLGNVVGNVAGGGMGSVKLEDPVHWSERQRMLKERTEQLQNSYNQSVLAQMTKQNADMRNAEMAKKRLEEQAAYRKAMADAAAKKANSSSQVNDAKIKWYNTKTGAIEEKTPEEIKKIQADAEKSKKQGNAAIIRANKYDGGSGGKSGKGSKTDLVNVSERYDRKGKLRGVTRTYKEKKGEKKSTGINWVSKNKK